MYLFLVSILLLFSPNKPISDIIISHMVHYNIIKPWRSPTLPLLLSYLLGISFPTFSFAFQMLSGFMHPDPLILKKRFLLSFILSIYIKKLKRSIYCCYTPIKPHQQPYHLPISHFSPLLPIIISLLLFHLSTTLNLYVTLHLSLPLPFILAFLILILLL